MLKVCLGLIPGALAYSWYFGWGVLANLALASLSALGTEGLILLLRRRPVRSSLLDGSAMLTGLLLGLTLPAVAPWWIPVFGAAFAIAFGKQLYGGLGYNPFNPAMLGYVVLLISFPAQMTVWLAPVAERAVDSASLLAYFSGAVGPASFDGLTSATPLDQIKTQLSQQLTVTEAEASMASGLVAGRGWDVINLAFLIGGIGLLAARTIRWQIPLGVLAGLGLGALVFSAVDADRYPGLLHHWFGGGAMLGAFFIATDPVSASTTPRGRLIFGFGVGLLTYLIRSFGGYPDAIAFSVLLMNICVPLIDHYTPPRVYGHGRARE